MKRTNAIKFEINQFNEKSNFSLACEGEKYAYPTKINRRSHIREDINYHGKEDLKAALNAGGKHDPLILDGQVVIHVLNETSLMVLWEKLEELYIAKSLTNTSFLWKQFYQLWMIKGQSI